MGPAADTIAAISTPPIPAAIGILRLSGPRAAQIAAVCFKPLGRKGLLEHRPHELVYGDLLDTEGAVIDRVLCTFSLAPHSYTGEDTAEIHCHGAPMVLQLGLEALFAAGARQAQRGEFTRRAFLNGKLDLPRRRRWATCWRRTAVRRPGTRRGSSTAPCPGGSGRSTPPCWM